MKLLQNAATYEIVDFTHSAEKQIELAARTCYQSYHRITKTSAKKLIKTLLSRNPPHETPLEFAYLTVNFKNVSRGMMAELTRHRLASFQVQSTRYVKQTGFNFVLPPDKNPKERINTAYEELSIETAVEVMEAFYSGLLMAGWKPEDARQFLPIGITTEISMCCNFREMRTIFKLRCDKKAHWEIRGIMQNLLKECIKRWPVCFEDLKHLLKGKE